MIINGEEFFTVKEMAKKLKIKPTAVKERLYTAGKKPIVKDALYDKAALDAISNVPGKGRPKKQAE